MSKQILTVDDSTSIRQMVCFTLRQAGFEVTEACDGVDALEKVTSASVDMALVDVNMPRMDGITLVKKLRSDARFRFIPIVMLTTESQQEKKMEGKAAGATGWIVKPFKPDQLLTVINKVLR